MTNHTLSERLRALAADSRHWDGDTMRRWEQIRKQVETMPGSDLPRLGFESLIENFAEKLDEAADALDARDRLIADAVRALEPFASGQGWGKLLAWIVEGAPERATGVYAAQSIVKWQRDVDATLAKLKAAVPGEGI